MSQGSERIETYVWRVAAVVVLGSVMAILDTTIINVALDTLHKRLHSPVSDVQWVVTGYLLSLAAVIPLTGWASRRFGARNVYLGSLLVFITGSALCGLATSISSLVAFRVLQGAGAGMVMPVGQLILADTAGPARLGRVASVTGVPSMLATVLGPTLGGLILQITSWQWIFYVNVPIGLLVVILGLRILPATGRQAQPPRLDVRGLALMVCGMPLLTYGLFEVGVTGGFSSARVIAPVLGGLAAIALFAAHAWRAATPLLDLRLFRNPTYASASLVMFWLGAAVYGALILFPLYFQQARHESVIATGLLVAPQGIGMALVTPLIGRGVNRVGGGPLALCGVGLTVIAAIPLGLVGAHTSLVWLSAVLVVRGIGLGLAFTPTNVVAFTSLERAQLPDAAPQMAVVWRLGGSIATAVLAVVLERAITGAGHAPRASAVAGAFGTTFWWTLGISVAALGPCLALMRSEARGRARRAAALSDDPPPARPARVTTGR